MEIVGQREAIGRPFKVREFDVFYPGEGDRPGIHTSRFVIERPNVVAIVALDSDSRILLVEQYRFGAGARLLEVPAGVIDPGEEPDAAARRELREETGYAADTLIRVGGAWSSPGFLDEYIHYYRAQNLRHDPLPQDAHEEIGPPVRMIGAEANVAISDGRIVDAKTITAIMFAILSV